jgi:hypothetical protein
MMARIGKPAAVSFFARARHVRQRAASMNIVQITPGAGGMYCGGCFHDNALVNTWRRLGHETLMLSMFCAG